MPFSRLATVLFCAVTLAGCTVMNGEALDSAVDRSIVTGSVAPAATPSVAPDASQVSDSRTVRNAVSSADLSSVVDGRPLAWTNADTGASGSITSITEAREGGVLCRSFTTSRQRFDGVSLYGGEACLVSEGEWVLTRFNEGG